MHENIDPALLAQLPEHQHKNIAFMRGIDGIFYAAIRADKNAEPFVGEVQDQTKTYKRKIVALLHTDQIPGFVEAAQTGTFDRWLVQNRGTIAEVTIHPGGEVYRKLRGWSRGLWKTSVCVLPVEDVPFPFAVGLIQTKRNPIFKAVLFCREGHKTADSKLLRHKIATDNRLVEFMGGIREKCIRISL